MKGWHIIVAALILAAGQIGSTWVDVWGYLESAQIECEYYADSEETDYL